MQAFPNLGIGGVIALVVLVVCVVLLVIGQLAWPVGVLIAALAVARLT